MNNPDRKSGDEQLEAVGELLAAGGHEDDQADSEVSDDQSAMAVEILRKLGGSSVTGFNPTLALRKELRIPKTDEDRLKLFGETLDRLCEVSLVRMREAKPDGPKDSRSVGLTWLGTGAYRDIFGRMAPVAQPQNR